MARTKKPIKAPKVQPLVVDDSKVKLPELLGFAEVAEVIGVAGNNLQMIKDLPRPVARVRATHLWLAKDIRAFAKVYQARRADRKAA